jgi:hypothetical protein
MRRSRKRWILGLVVACFAASIACTLAGCPGPLSDCRNTLTCPPCDAGDEECSENE